MPLEVKLWKIDKGVKSFRAVAQIEIFSALTEPSGYNALSYSQLLKGAKP